MLTNGKIIKENLPVFEDSEDTQEVKIVVFIIKEELHFKENGEEPWEDFFIIKEGIWKPKGELSIEKVETKGKESDGVNSIGLQNLISSEIGSRVNFIADGFPLFFKEGGDDDFYCKIEGSKKKVCEPLKHESQREGISKDRIVFNVTD